MTQAPPKMLPYSNRITHDPGKMGGQACVRGLRITAANVVRQLADGLSEAEILAAYPDLEAEDIPAVLSFAAWRLSEAEAFVPR
ncbi:MAG: DUF433 domain-containing protein [Dehalococcoidia bacterium]